MLWMDVVAMVVVDAIALAMMDVVAKVMMLAVEEDPTIGFTSTDSDRLDFLQ